MEEIWKLPPPKKELWRCTSSISSSSSSNSHSPFSSSCCSSSSSPTIQNRFLQKMKTHSNNSNSRFALPRSFSTKSHYSSSSSSSACYNNNDSPLLKRSSSLKCSLPRSLSQKSSKIARKCSCLAKEQRARFYIIKRCVSMLICWNKHSGFDY